MGFFDDTYSQSLIIVILLMMYVAFQSFIEHKKIHLLHETGFGIIIGFLLGFIMYEFDEDVSFSGEEFFQIILPPIIFAAGYNMKKKKFFSNIFYISLYAVVGTLVNFFITLFITEGAQSAGWIVDMNGSQVNLQTRDILYFSATMCASDAIAALTLINSAAYPKLFSIVFGEGLLNDAVAIILFDSVDSIVSSTGETILTKTVILELFGNFFKNCVLSVLIGVGTALLATFLSKQFRFLVSDPIKENIFLLLIGYGTYCLAQICDVSSVIALLTSGILMSHYMRYNMSDYGRISTGITVSTLSQVSESFLFIYLGMTSWSYITNPSKVSASFLGLSFGITCIARLGCIYVTSGIAYLVKRKTWMVNRYEMSIIWFAGLIRGAVAFALIQTVEDKLNPVVISTILFIVFFTTVGLGALMPVYVKYFTKKMSLSEKVKMKELFMKEREKDKQIEKERKKIENKDKKQGFSLRRLDDIYLKPFLIYDYENRKEEIIQEKLKQKLAEGGESTNELTNEAEVGSFDYANNPVLSEIKHARSRIYSMEPQHFQKSFQKSSLIGYAAPSLNKVSQKPFESEAIPPNNKTQLEESSSKNNDNDNNLLALGNNMNIDINISKGIASDNKKNNVDEENINEKNNNSKDKHSS